MIKKIVLDAIPHEDFLINFSQLVNSCDSKSLIFLDFSFWKYISSFANEKNKIILHSDISENAKDFTETDNSSISFRIINSKVHSWFFETCAISKEYVILTNFSYLHQSLHYKPPKDFSAIEKTYYISVNFQNISK